MESIKQYEILVKRYYFDKYLRVWMKIHEPAKWEHYKNYKTLEAATDALRDIMKNNSVVDYPGYGDSEREKIYPHITPQIQIKRFKIQKRNI